MVAAQVPGSDPDPNGIGPVVFDPELSPTIYGDRVDVFDGIDDSEVETLRSVGARIRWCLVRDDKEGDYWQWIIPDWSES